MAGFVVGGGILPRSGFVGVRVCSSTDSKTKMGVRASVVRMGLLDRARKDWDLVKEHVNMEKIGQALATAAVVGALMFAPMESAMAASGGGRVGGSSFRSAPSSNYSPGYGGGGVYTAPVAPIMPVTPFMPFSPFMPMMAVSFFSPTTFILLGATAILVTSLSRGSNSITSFERSTVTTLKVGLLSSARSLQGNMDRIARTADTSSPEGLSYLLSETALSLLRHPDYWTHAAINTTSTTEAENMFGQRSMQERAKINEFTLLNVNSNRTESMRASATEADMSKAPSEYIYVTMVVAAEGSVPIPESIGSAEELKAALEVLGGIDATQMQAVDILWAPQSQQDTLSLNDLTVDNPELRRL